MLGGGTFITQNKVLPGAYINFVSAARAQAMIGERGKAAIAIPLSWGNDDSIFEVTADEFRTDCLEYFGVAYDSEEAKGLRDLFRNIETLYCYKLMKNGTKASNSVAKAKWNGKKGNQISTEILTGTTTGTFDANVFFENVMVYSANVRSVEELKATDNGFVTWDLETLVESERQGMTGGSDGEEITAAEHSRFLDLTESYAFNAIGCLSADKEVQELYIQEVKDMRDNAGIKYQAVVFNNAADHEAVVSVKNCVDAVWWTLGVIAG